MNKRKTILGIIALLLLYAIYWTIEPYSLNPFSVKSSSLSQSTSKLNCRDMDSFSEKADRLINASIKNNDFLGLSTGVYSDSCGSWFSTAGYTNKRFKEEPDQNSLFRIASISKPMTAVAILQLYESGKVDLDLPIQNYLPDFPKKVKGDITIRQLLNHTSGISNYKTAYESVRFTNSKDCFNAMDIFKDRELDFEPGSGFSYTSYGYTILGAIIEKVTKQSYNSYMSANIWKPLEMTQTNIENSTLKYENKADLYIKSGNSFFRFPQNDLSHSYSGGGIQSTTQDMLKFGKAILNYELLSPKTTDLMIQLSDSNTGEKEYTLGWYRWQSPTYGKYIEHNGKQVGCSSFFRIFLDKKVVVATLTNNMNSREEVRKLSIDLSYLLMKMEND